MSRLLTALKRLDESGGQTPAASVVAQPAIARVTASSTRPEPAAVGAESVPFHGRVDEIAWPSAESFQVVGSPADEFETFDSAPFLVPTNEPQNAEEWPSGTPANSTVERRTRSVSPSPNRRSTDQYDLLPEYAALCDSILARLSKARPMAILIVPAAEHVDASTVAAELSLSMAQTLDLPVIAMDADLPGASTEADSAVSAAGLSDVLIDRVDWRGILSTARDERVKLLVAGRPVTSADSYSPAIARLGPIITEMKTRYRCLIIHGGAPTNPLTSALTQTCDLVYLALRLNRTTRRVAKAAKRTLQRGGALVHGSILITGP
jgi:Mrp family chromosome partitioning ATPase